MRFVVIPALILASLLPCATFASPEKLFIIRKPVNPENLVQTFVLVDAKCALGNLDFVWLMEGVLPKIPNAILRCNILKRLAPVALDTANKAGCPKKIGRGMSCTQKFILPEEMNILAQQSPLVIRSIRHANGSCEVGAFMEVGGKVIQVKQMNANGRLLEQGLTGATVEFSGVQIIATDGTMAADWPCTHDCMQKVSADFFCNL